MKNKITYIACTLAVISIIGNVVAGAVIVSNFWGITHKTDVEQVRELRSQYDQQFKVESPK